MILSDMEISVLKNWSSRAAESISIVLESTEDERTDQFIVFCDGLVEVVPNIQYTVKEVRSSDLPALVVGHWRYHCVPRGSELEPFLHILSPERAGTTALVNECLRSVFFVPEMKIFVTQQCPFCPGAIRQLIPVVLSLAGCRMEVIDSLLFPEMAEAFQVRAVPTLVINGTYRITGEIHSSAVVEFLEKSDASQLQTASLERMLKEGQAKLLGDLMLKKRLVFPGFLPLITHPEWSVRLGAMVVLEEIAQSDGGLAGRALEPVWREYARHDASVRGDILYLIGELGASDWIEVLEPLMEREDDDQVRSVLMETISRIRSKQAMA